MGASTYAAKSVSANSRMDAKVMYHCDRDPNCCKALLANDDCVNPTTTFKDRKFICKHAFFVFWHWFLLGIESPRGSGISGANPSCLREFVLKGVGGCFGGTTSHRAHALMDASGYATFTIINLLMN